MAITSNLFYFMQFQFLGFSISLTRKIVVEQSDAVVCSNCRVYSYFVYVAMVYISS